MRAPLARLVRFVIAAIVVGVPGGVGAQGITAEQAQQMVNELRQIRQLLERTPPAPLPRAAAPAPAVIERVRVGLGSGFALGRPDAPLTLVEFTDLECPFCRQFHLSTFEQLKKEYIDTGKLRYVSRDLPLDFHRHAMPAALAARCAGEQGRFWEMRHVLIVNAKSLGQDAMSTFARDLGLDMDRFGACLTGERYRAEVQKDIADAQAAGLSGTPTFVLGATSKDGIEGIKIVGALPYAVFEAKIRELLRE